MEDNTIIKIKRQWNDSMIAEVEFSKISNLHWDNISGGVRAPAPQFLIHGFVFCDTYKGDLAHSCQHGSGPHRIKICITKTDNDPKTFKELISIVGDKPRYIPRRRRRSLLT